MNRIEFGQAFQRSGEVTLAQLRELATATGTPSPEEMSLAVLDSVLLEFSRDRARIVTTTASAWGGVAVALSGWFAHSSILYVESPVGSHPRTDLRSTEYEIDRETGSLYLTGVEAGAQYRVRYRALHEIAAMPTGGSAPTDATIPTALAPAYFKLAAAAVFDRLASRYAETVGSGFSADAVSWQTQSGEYRKLADRARAQYRQLLGLTDAPAVEAVGFSVELEQADYRSQPEGGPWTV